MTHPLALDPNITMAEIAEKAAAGHPTAQYNMAKAKEGEGDTKACLDWMRKSAEQDFIPAQFELGMWHLLGHIVEYNQEKAVNYIKKAAEAPYGNALRLLSTLHGLGFAFEKNWEKTVEYLIKAADIEDPYALRQIGFLLRQSKDHQDLGKRVLARGASLNEPICCLLLDKAPGTVTAEEMPAGWDQWTVIRDYLLGLEGLCDTAHKELCADPQIQKFTKALTPEECLYLREMGRPSLIGGVQLLGGNPDDPSYRELQTGRVMILFPVVQDIVTILLTRRLAHLAEAPVENAELMVIHHYAEGQEFQPHTDYMDPEDPQHAFSIQQSGQRIKSVFCYLNGDYKGGETAFTKIGLKVKGKEGDVLVIDNMDAIGLPNPATEHASLPVTSGEKWLATLWIRDKNQLSRSGNS